MQRLMDRQFSRQFFVAITQVNANNPVRPVMSSVVSVQSSPTAAVQSSPFTNTFHMKLFNKFITTIRLIRHGTFSKSSPLSVYTSILFNGQETVVLFVFFSFLLYEPLQVEKVLC